MVKTQIVAVAAAAVAASSSLVEAQQCKPMCGNNAQVLQAKQCTSQSLASAPFLSCCDDGKVEASCEEGRECRSIEYSTSFGCQSTGLADMCIQAGEVMKFSVNIDIDQRPGSCCSKCHCAGDPHCFAFDGKADDWIICDARDAKLGCSLTQSMCQAQKDQLGNTCVWNPATKMCNKPSTDPLASMLFYKKDSTSIEFVLGDRGVIEKVTVRQDKNVISLNVTDCVEHPQDPWIGTPIGKLTSSNYGKEWTYSMREVKSELTVKCIKQSTAITGPHLDVDIVDETIAPGAKPVGVSGFCGTGSIDKQKSTSTNTDNIRTGNLCSKSPNRQIAAYFNNGKVPTPSQLPKVVKRYCAKYAVVSGSTKAQANQQTKKCYKDIMPANAIGWEKVFCADSTLATKDPAQCTTTVDCNTCLSDIGDFGWEYAINKWDKTKQKGPKPGPPCIGIEKLPMDLTECQRGIRIQYSDNGKWVTYRAIPQGYTLCPNSGDFNSLDDAVLFKNKIRFTQCTAPANLPEGTCPDSDAEKCDSDDGFSVSIKTSKETKTSELEISDLVDKGVLICDPIKYPSDPQGCFKEPFVECTGCKGVCKVDPFVDPCHGKDCGMCPEA